MKIEEMLDSLEEIMIIAIIPTIREIKKNVGIEMDDREMARNMMGKVGTRIAFGKEVYDRAVFPKQ